jgi:hypothetical protein
MPFPDDLVTTRLSLHAVAEHVLAPALYASNGHIGLRRAPGGFATPSYLDGDVRTTAGVSGTELVVRRGDAERWFPLTTIRAAADVVGGRPGATGEVYPPATPLELDRPLDISAPAAKAIADLFEIADEALTSFAAAHPDDSPTSIQLWPEHFDIALSSNEVNFGGCPGDDSHPSPYFYVGPWSPRTGSFWTESFGATLPFRAGLGVEEILEFFERGRECAAEDLPV